MKRLTPIALSILLAASVVSCNRDDRADTNERATGGGAVGTTGASVDRDFVMDMAEGNRAEIELAKMAEERATNAQVKDFARMLVRDHTKALADLREAAAAANVQLSTSSEENRDQKNLQEDLAKLTGHEFDRKYIDEMIGKHEKTANAIEKKVDSESPQIRQWATETLPVVRKHLDQAKQLKETLDKAHT
jgi:putative membrane protein